MYFKFFSLNLKNLFIYQAEQTSSLHINDELIFISSLQAWKLMVNLV